ncbi:class I SAM-dependent methyltransferase [Stakelama tenebrarum]|uniref:Methyltransferase domain-containing protein n=1 Tax=Stakelama tenebrarum TaxID=2711215 RepID=A0A6G6Y3N0_9SPHN|nr:class I SAM-dependent methyltransferase [Sphingosinithalassobacter tenebrarum]QIG79554.1 methyltransferase domain-containing protein [Sphingosinithalassobacter tenebrarum]
MPIPYEQSYRAAFGEYAGTLRQLVSQYPDARVLELGGGRKPSFALNEMPDNIASYTVNDISADELAMAGEEYDKACFDVIGDVSGFEGQFDVIFSRTLIEHVRDGVMMHRNIHRLLKPGGVAFHMAPTLYSPPFVVNKLLPETLSEKILYALTPHRQQKKSKFPAYYSWCLGNRDKMTRMLTAAGFSKVNIRTFYGHGYFDKVPIARELDNAVSMLAAKRDWSPLGSYAHITTYR